MSYNGWSNYETYVISLWLGDEIERLIEDMGSDNVYDLTCGLRETVLGEIDESGLNGFLYDLIMSAADRIDYEELIRAYLPEEEEA